MLLFKIVNNGSFGLKYFGLLLFTSKHYYGRLGTGIPIPILAWIFPSYYTTRGLSEVRPNTYMGFLSFSDGIVSCAPNYSNSMIDVILGHQR